MKQEQINKEIEKRNKLFKSASNAEKRVLIAKDVLKLLSESKIEAQSGTWVEIDNDDYINVGEAIDPNCEIENADEYEKLEKKFEKSSLREYILKEGVSCQCCALGSMMTSCTLFKNKVTVDDYNVGGLVFPAFVDESREDKLNFVKLFGGKQLALIEIAFEKGDGYFNFDLWEDESEKDNKENYRYAMSELDRKFVPSYEQAVKALKFGYKYESNHSRLVAIMKNIVKNKGTFNP